MAMIRTFSRHPFTLWADRVPVMHGNATLYTLWEKTGERNVRICGGKRLYELKAIIRNADNG